jgi:hypothetical protein
MEIKYSGIPTRNRRVRDRTSPGSSRATVETPGATRDVQPCRAERHTHQGHREGVDQGSRALIGPTRLHVLRQEARRPWDQRDPQQQIEVEKEQAAIHALEVSENCVVVDPDDSDDSEADDVGGLRRPPIEQRVRELTVLDLRYRNLEDEQRDRDREDPVAEGLEPAGGHRRSGSTRSPQGDRGTPAHTGGRPRRRSDSARDAGRVARTPRHMRDMPLRTPRPLPESRRVPVRSAGSRCDRSHRRGLSSRGRGERSGPGQRRLPHRGMHPRSSRKSPHSRSTRRYTAGALRDRSWWVADAPRSQLELSSRVVLLRTGQGGGHPDCRSPPRLCHQEQEGPAGAGPSWGVRRSRRRSRPRTPRSCDSRRRRGAPRSAAAS